MVISDIAKTLTNLTRNTNKSNFQNVNNIDNMSFSEFLIFLIIFIVLLVILMVLGTIVFNFTIPRIFPNVRKVKTVEFFGLYVILHILFC